MNPTASSACVPRRIPWVCSLLDDLAVRGLDDHPFGSERHVPVGPAIAGDPQTLVVDRRDALQRSCDLHRDLSSVEGRRRRGTWRGRCRTFSSARSRRARATRGPIDRSERSSCSFCLFWFRRQQPPRADRLIVTDFEGADVFLTDLSADVVGPNACASTNAARRVWANQNLRARGAGQGRARVSSSRRWPWSPGRAASPPASCA